MTALQAERYFMEHATYQDSSYFGPFYSVELPGTFKTLHDKDVYALRQKFAAALAEEE